MRLQITNGNIFTQDGWVNGGSVLCKNGKITEISSDPTPREGYVQLDAEGLVVGPGGIDMHLHGGGGKDFMECTEEAFRTTISTHMKHGTTALFPTLASSSNKMIRDAAEICTRLMKEKDTPVMGLHLEGPYFNMKKCGGQWPDMIRLADPEEYIPLLDDYPCIRRWDAAPELPGAMEFGKECARRGIVAGIGHTEADEHDVEAAVKAGYSHVTHLYNAMTGVHNVREFKHAGTIESVLIADEMTVEVIADGIHVPPVLMKLVNKVKGSDKMALVTDAMAATGDDSGVMFDKNTILEDGVAKLADRSALAGSIATMDRLVGTVINKCHLPWDDAFIMSSSTPARIMGIYDRKGSLAPGKDADICIYTKDAKLKHVIQAGKRI